MKSRFDTSLYGRRAAFPLRFLRKDRSYSLSFTETL